MPTLFSRRYMRGRPGPTEQVIGGVIIVLLLSIIGAFTLTSGFFKDTVENSEHLMDIKNFIGISEKPLFVAALENQKPPAPPHELRTAKAMLPVQVGSWMRNDVQAEMVRAGDVDAIEWAALYDARWRYVGGYREMSAADDGAASEVVQAGMTGTGRGAESTLRLLTIQVVDVAEPANAFGLCRSRQSEDRRSIPVGSNGWLSAADGRAGFWAGRYYTELSGDGLNSTELEDAARQVAGMQLVYGGPFWGDQVLPHEGREADSLNYLKSRPLGLDELKDVWTASYENGVTLGVARPSSVEKVQDALRERLGETLTGRVGDRQVVARVSGPFLLLAVGASESGVESGELENALAALTDRTAATLERVQPADGRLVGALGGQGERQGKARFAAVDDSAIEAPTKTERYSDDLYSKINGKEGMFRAFYIVDLRFGLYLDTRAGETYDAYIFDMGEPANALGIFMKERSSSAESIALGRDGYVSGSSVYYWKGPYYINILAPGEPSDAKLAKAMSIAEAIGDTIADDGEPFWAESVLPSDQRVEKSFRYIAQSGLGYEFMPRVFMADYESTEGTPYQMFITRAADASEARSRFDQLAEATAKYDEIVERESDRNGAFMVADSLGIFSAVFQDGPFIGGVIECDVRELAATRAARLREQLPSGDAIAAEPAYGSTEPVEASTQEESESSGYGAAETDAPSYGENESTESEEAGYGGGY